MSHYGAKLVTPRLMSESARGTSAGNSRTLASMSSNPIQRAISSAIVMLSQSWVIILSLVLSASGMGDSVGVLHFVSCFRGGCFASRVWMRSYPPQCPIILETIRGLKTNRSSSYMPASTARTQVLQMVHASPWVPLFQHRLQFPSCRAFGSNR